ncbi:Filamin-A [Fragariocoptes setiger]|uniref:Filamin-A n=1 Tax=Fragariocoptes setiger TaxID=1670756 RepID=A0ABQ7SCC7_9ACAR|nr:Filamin-A [Fragariocoptes setiger]
MTATKIGPLRVQKLESVPINQSQSFDIICPGARLDDLLFEVSYPQGWQQDLAGTSDIQHKLVATNESHGIFRGCFSLPLVGSYNLTVSVRDQPAHLSTSFTCNGYDLNGIVILGAAKRCYMNEQYEFNVEASGAGAGSLEIAINSGQVANSVRMLDNGKCIVSFLPEENITHEVDIKFNGHNVPGCPFTVDVQKVDDNRPYLHVDSSLINLMKIGKRAKFKIHSSTPENSRPVQISKLHIQILSPNGVIVPHEMSNSSKNELWCEFTPLKVGSYTIECAYSGDHLPESPLVVKAYDSSKVLVTTEHGATSIVDRPVRFSINATNSGEGSLIISCTRVSNGQNIPTQVNPLGGAIFEVTFVPKYVDEYSVNITFNDQQVLGSPFTIQVTSSVLQSSQKVHNNDSTEKTDKDNSSHLKLDAISISGEGSTVACVNTKTTFNVSNLPGPLERLSVSIEDPKGRMIPASIIPGFEPGSATVEYTTETIGEHRICINYSGNPLPDTPLTSKSFDLNAIKVTQIPKEIELNKEQSFKVDASRAGTGVMELIVAANGKNVPNYVKALSSIEANRKTDPTSAYMITFTPTEPCAHTIDILFNSIRIPGSPFVCELAKRKSDTYGTISSGSRDGSQRASLRVQKEERILVGSLTEIILESHTVIRKSEFKLLDPEQHQIEFELIEISSQHQLLTYKIEFTPQLVGDYKLDLTNDSLRQVFESEKFPLTLKAFDHKKVKVSEIDDSGVVGVPIYFSIDASQGGTGNLEIVVRNSKGENVPNYVQSEGSANFRVNFRPNAAEPHEVSIKFNKIPIPGSPFRVKVSNSSQSLIAGLAALKALPINRPATFTINCPANAKVKQPDKKDCKVTIDTPTNRQCYADVTLNQRKDKDGFVRSIFTVKFTPNEIGPHMINAILFNELVPGCPITSNVFDVESVQVHFNDSHANLPDGYFARGYLNKPVTFQVNASSSGEGCLEIEILSHEEQSGHKSSVRAEVLMKSRGLYDVTFVPREKLPHSISITFNGENVIGSPFKVDVVEYVSEDSQTELETSMNSLKLKDQSSERTSSHSKDFTPEATGLVEVTNFVILEPNLLNEKKYSIKIINPKGVSLNYTIKRFERNGTKGLRIEYKPVDVGKHFVDIREQLSGEVVKTHTIEVIDPNRVRTLGLEDGMAGCEQSFKIDTTRAGQAHITLSMEMNHRHKKADSIVVDHSMKKLSDGIYQVYFTPPVSGCCYIDIKFGNHSINNRPLAISVADNPRINQHSRESSLSRIAAHCDNNNSSSYVKSKFESDKVCVYGETLKSAPINKTGAFVIETGGYAQAKDFDVIISDPAGSPIPVQCYDQQNGSLQAEWTPLRVGIHQISVLYNGNHVTGSPFTSQVFDVSSIMIQNVKSFVYPINEKITFNLDRKDAGYGDLSVTVTSPLGRDLPIDVRSNGEHGETVSFIPTVAGKYKISITFSGFEVPGSPITFIAQDPRDKVITKGSGLKRAIANETNSFEIETTSSGELKVRIECGDREIVPKLDKKSEKSYLVRYKPASVGHATISVFWNGEHVTGSPFKVPIVDPKKLIYVNGIDKKRHAFTWEPHMVSEIIVDTFECGPGEVTAELWNQNRPEIRTPVKVEQLDSTRYRLTFVCSQHETSESRTFSAFILQIYYNGISVGEPLVGHIRNKLSTSNHRNKSSSSENQSSKRDLVKPAKNDPDCPSVVLRGYGLAGARCGETTEFTIDGANVSPDRPRVFMTGSEADIDVDLRQVDDKLWKATYVAQQPGCYMLNVYWGDKQVRGCPLKVNILPSCDSNRVVCSGDLKGGILGKEIKTFIDTRRAGPSELTALCNGPTKVAFCELLDQGDGTFILFIKPQEAGRHYLTIKYGGVHIPRSPFVLKVSGAPEASKVRVYGPGIEHGVLPLFQSRFVCDTRGAGSGQLTARIRGPKGAFRMETHRESQKDRTIVVRYDPQEPGDYRIEIKWAGVHVPGSPFTVMIFDTQEELNAYLMSQESNSKYQGYSKRPSLTGPTDTKNRANWQASASEI